MDALPEDIISRVKRDFSADQVTSVLARLSSYDGKEPARVIRCIVQLSNGSEERLSQNLVTAMADYRDILYFAEYDQEDKRRFDFRKPFPKASVT